MHDWFEIYGDFAEWAGCCLLVEFHQEGSASADCAAGLFYNTLKVDGVALLVTKPPLVFKIHLFGKPHLTFPKYWKQSCNVWIFWISDL